VRRAELVESGEACRNVEAYRTSERKTLRRFWRLVSDLLVVPAFRLGLGPLVGNPISGYVMVVRTVGRRTGRTRYTPVTYSIAGGGVYCLAGYGRSTHWYRNALAAPEVCLLLPGRSVAGHAQEVVDAAERLAATRRIFRNAGLMGFTEGFDPFRADDETVRLKTAEMPVLRIDVAGIAGGPFDPGGRAWLAWPVIGLVALVLVARARMHSPSRASRRRA
jgi:deazaflavin-dependent oxidoreductase (nitroreductase family)